MTAGAPGAIARRRAPAVLGWRRMRGVVALLGLGLGLLAGCKPGGSAPPPPAAAPPSPAAAGSARSITGTGAAAGPAASAAAAPHVTLPRSPDTPLRRSRRPLDRARLDRLAAIEFADFERQDRGRTDAAAEFRHTTRSRPKLAVTVMVGPCTAERRCPAMNLPAWTARRDELLQQLPRALRSRGDTRFEIGARAIAGAPAIAVYELGYSAGTDDHDQPSVEYIDAYVVHYNDGVNQIRVMAHYVDDTLGGIDQLLAVAPPDDLEKLAAAFASYYVHTWD